MISEWLSEEYLKKGCVEHLRRSFLSAKPFPCLHLKNIFKREKFNMLRNALFQQEFTLKESDLFSLAQTGDFAGTTNPVLKEFRDFLLKDFRIFMEEITGEKFSKKNIDLAGSLYNDTHHLLCHDDQLEDRNIAFILYCSSLTKKEGGALRLFDNKNGSPSEIVKDLRPVENSLAFFKVSKISFHDVEEVRDARRYAIGGWYHE